MYLTRAGEYALQGVLHLAMQPNGKVTLLSEISRERCIPQSFLGKIFRHLVKGGIVKSIRGAKGGYILARPARLITMRDVVESVEGRISLNQCLTDKGRCVRTNGCAMFGPWREAQTKALDVLNTVTFEYLANKEKKLKTRE